MIRASFAVLAALSVSSLVPSDALAQYGKGGHGPVASGRSAPASAPSAQTSPVRGQQQPPAVVLIPIVAPILPGPVLSLAPDQPRAVHVRSAPARSRVVQPLSVHPIDPFTVVSRTPSGRVVLSSLRSGVVHPGRQRFAAVQGPYAPPAFHIIGAADGRHMSKPVRLTHGVKGHRGLKTEPQVVFLQDKR
jgi:hypothetical protein